MKISIVTASFNTESTIEKTIKNVIAEIYTAADIFVNPSKEETFGMTTVEALACGIKAIVYQGTACEEIVKEKGGMAVPMKVNSIFEQIIKLG